MSYHHNEKDEWLRYGAAIYLRNCNKAVVHDNVVTGGQCALMLTESNDGFVYNNYFSYNSGIGVGMYRSNRNKIVYNRLDFNVRGYSYSVYNRGQDSGGILVFEQCNENLFANNSVTHSGDGFFLWAGQTTMDTGEGGCNDNEIFWNDFSFAPTNGVEVTFSRNYISGNKIEGCDYGIWGGYSYQSLMVANIFKKNRIGIAIEHGQHNKLVANEFDGDGEGLKFWSKKEQPLDWGYARKRDTRSVDLLIAGNQFHNVKTPISIVNTDSINLWDNAYDAGTGKYNLGEGVTNVDSSDKYLAYCKNLMDSAIYLPIPKEILYKSGEWLVNKRGDRSQIRITEWGPYDFRYPLVWRTNPADTSGLLQFDVIGPSGKWKLVSAKGIYGFSRSSDSFPSKITASKIKGSKGGILIELEYTGQEFTDQFGKTFPAHKPYRFRFRDSRVPIKWNVSWYSFDSLSNPVTNSANWNKILAQGPVLQQKTKSLDYAWWGGISANGRQYEMFVTVAAGEIEVTPGSYELSTTWDDAVRVYLDGKLIINEWNPSQYTFDESPNKTIQIQLSGHHQLRVEHVELGGFATINLKLKKL
jgi:hypothetical protein